MLEELKKYYIENGISANSFVKNAYRCKHYERCSTRLDGGKKIPFYEAKEAFISTRYELHKVPRLLVVSLDPKYSSNPIYSSVYNTPAKRTLENVRNQEEFSSGDSYYDWPLKSHWRKTYDCLFVLLKRFLGYERDRREIRHYFAHTNSAKCHDKPESDQASDELFFNCREYLPPEILILDPDVVITQGKFSYFSYMEKFITPDAFPLPERFRHLNKVHPIQINDHNALWIEMNHPCRHDDFYQKQDVINFNQYGELIYELWQNR